MADSDFYGYGGMYCPYGYWGGETTIQTGTRSYCAYDCVDGSLIIDL